MKKIVFALAIILSSCISCINHSKEFVDIGVILPLTGESAELGKPIQEAMLLAISNINDTISSYKMRLLFEDGKSTASGSMFAFNKLRNSNPSCYVVFGDVPCSSLAKSLEQYNTPVITLAAAAGNILTLNENYFRSWTTSAVSSEKIVDYSIDKLGASRGAIFCMNNNYGKEFAREISYRYEAKGGDILIEEYFSDDVNLINSSAYKIINQKPDVVFIIGFGNGYTSAIKQLRVLGYNGPIMTDDTITISDYNSNLSPYLNNIYFSSIDFSPYDKNSSNYETFVLPFTEKMNQLPNVHSVFGYITVEVIADAIQRCGTSATDIQNGLKDMKGFHSIIGELTYLSNRELDLPVIVRQIGIGGTY